MSPSTAACDGSGLEIVSPHKVVSTRQQFPCIIEGIGELRTAWIGHKGVSFYTWPDIVVNKLVHADTCH